MDKNILKIKPSGIFTNYIYKAIPLAFDESMSYYETLCGILSLLKTQEEVVNNNADLLAELELYVQDYFKNLDVQTEINNKLDEMAKDGTLEEIIAQYVNLSSILAYNSVADMKNSTNLINGSFAKTYGFYNINDDGGAYYKIRNVTTNDNVDNATLIAINNTLVAELIIEKEMNVKQFGAKGDGSTDDTSSIQKCLDNCKNILIENGTYLVNTDTSLFPKSNSNITLINATLKAIPNSLDNYAILRLNNVENVLVEGGTLEGDRLTHTATTGEWGHCISIRNSNNITLRNMILTNAWGDGLYVATATNINTENIIVDNARRNGYSLISVENFKSLNDTIKNINGTAPQSGVDIEPNYATENLKNIVFDNLNTFNCSGAGFEIHLANEDDTSDVISITLNDYFDEGSVLGMSIYKNRYTKGLININRPMLRNNALSGIRLQQCYYSNLKLTLYRPVILNCNKRQNSSPKYGCSIACFLEPSDAQYNLGNIDIIEPYLTNEYTNDRYMYIDAPDDYPTKDFKLINPLNNDEGKNLTLYNFENLIFKDDYEMFTIDSNNSLEISSYNTYSVVYNSRYSVSRTNTITASFPVGREITFINNSLTEYDLGIKLPANTYCRALTSNASPTII